ncbi:DnaD domain protein [Paenibacillus sp. RS8]|uniref:DnaD domain protein n=1 Tax=Paenibacillus sp. RS8 TaxID=3242681 RepID=UPI0035C138CF
MDFANEMTAFTDWLETNPLEPSAQTLLVHLMVIANKSGYPEWFAVTNPLLMAKVGISENSLTKHRNTLIQKGRIEYKNQGKQQAGKYRLNLFTSNNAVKGEVNRAVKYAVKGEVKGSALLRSFKDLKSSSTSSSADQQEYESYYMAHKRVFGFECNPFQANKLGVYIDQDGLEESVVIRAIERAGLASKGYRFNLITTILDDYFHAGAITLSAAVALDAAYDASQQSTTWVPKSGGNTPKRQGGKVDRIAELRRKAKEEEKLEASASH